MAGKDPVDIILEALSKMKSNDDENRDTLKLTLENIDKDHKDTAKLFKENNALTKELNKELKKFFEGEKNKQREYKKEGKGYSQGEETESFKKFLKDLVTQSTSKRGLLDLSNPNANSPLLAQIKASLTGIDKAVVSLDEFGRKLVSQFKELDTDPTGTKLSKKVVRGVGYTASGIATGVLGAPVIRGIASGFRGLSRVITDTSKNFMGFLMGLPFLKKLGGVLAAAIKPFSDLAQGSLVDTIRLGFYLALGKIRDVVGKHTAGAAALKGAYYFGEGLKGAGKKIVGAVGKGILGGSKTAKQGTQVYNATKALEYLNKQGISVKAPKYSASLLKAFNFKGPMTFLDRDTNTFKSLSSKGNISDLTMESGVRRLAGKGAVSKKVMQGLKAAKGVTGAAKGLKGVPILGAALEALSVGATFADDKEKGYDNAKAATLAGVSHAAGIAMMFTPLGPFFGGLLGTFVVQPLVHWLLEKIYDPIKNIITNFLTPIKNFLGWLWRGVKGIWNHIFDRSEKEDAEKSSVEITAEQSPVPGQYPASPNPYNITGADLNYGNITKSGSNFKKGQMFDRHEITSTFGNRWHPTKHRWLPHEGVDLAYKMNEPVSARIPGIVSFFGEKGGYGLTVEIDDQQDQKTYRYAHLNSIMKGLAVGASVNAGDIIGYAGSTGDSTGTHLHYEVIDKKTNKSIEPLSYTTKRRKELGITESPVPFTSPAKSEAVPSTNETANFTPINGKKNKVDVTGNEIFKYENQLCGSKNDMVLMSVFNPNQGQK